MIRHLLRLAWSRKRANALLVTEVFFSFLVVFAVATLAVVLWSNARRPTGFRPEGVWDIGIDMQVSSDDVWTPAQIETFARVLREAAGDSRVEAAAGALSAPYDLGGRSDSWSLAGRGMETQVNEVTDGFAEVLGLDVTSGRWFSAEDDRPDWRPVVLNEALARALFAEEDPIGRPLPIDEPGSERTVVGIVAEFRQGGEFSLPGNYMFVRKRLDDPEDRPGRTILVRVGPGADVAGEMALLGRLRAAAPEWNFDLTTLEAKRQRSARLRLAPIAAGGIVGAFLLIMVGLGLTGVLWQNVTRRTREIGLRRALGACAGDVQRQILLEVLIIASAGIGLGALVAAQIPILDLLGPVGGAVFAGSLAMAAFVILALVAACAYYPGRLATLVQPAEALHND